MSRGREKFDDVGLVIAAGGSSTRFGAGNKLFTPLQGLPIFCHCLKTFAAVIPADLTVLVVPPARETAFRQALADTGLGQGLRIVAGGATRQTSVINGLRALPAKAVLVAVHDAARPLAGAELLRRCIVSARKHGTGVAAHRVTETIKTADRARQVRATPERSTLWVAETPQVFLREWLDTAYAALVRDGGTVTDDAQAVEQSGRPVILVEDPKPNPKMTYAADLQIAEALVHH